MGRGQLEQRTALPAILPVNDRVEHVETQVRDDLVTLEFKYSGTRTPCGLANATIHLSPRRSDAY
jgi:hypothetical protein